MIDQKVSVVIPTLGGAALARTIQMINTGKLVPDEILICIPKEFAERTNVFSDTHNVRVVATESKGQVQQRIEGFKQVKNEFVVQVDDDMFVYETCIEKLVTGLIESKEDVAIAPAIIYDYNGLSCYAGEFVNTPISKIIHGNKGYIPGKITRAGTVVGINVLNLPDRYTEVDWLPGGCVAHKKKSLVLENFYPFAGKAFFEDVIHSVCLRNKGVKLLIDNTAKCGIDDVLDGSYSSETERTRLFNELKYRKLIVRLEKKPAALLYLDFLYHYLQISMVSLKHKLFGKG